jgi:hypothetical protein
MMSLSKAAIGGGSASGCRLSGCDTLNYVIYRACSGITVVKALRYKSECRWFDPRWCH